MAVVQLGEWRASLLSAFPTLAFCFLLSLPWVNANPPSGCLRNTGCLNDFERWSQRVSYPEGPEIGVAGSFRGRDQLLRSPGFTHPDPLWIPFKEVAVTLTYQLAEGPEVICAQMLQGCAKQALEKLEKHTPEEDPSEWAEVCLLRAGWAARVWCFP